eukprot:jgi/Galph1/5435/GphlegSOOS_G4008.1
MSESFVSVPLVPSELNNSSSAFVVDDEEPSSTETEQVSVRKDSKTSEEQVEQLMEIFGSSGNVNREDLLLLLDIYDGDGDRVAAVLLEQESLPEQLAQDMQIARILQDEDSAFATSTSPSNSVEESPLPASSRERFITSVKEILIPQLQTELVGMRFPNIENTGQKYEYQLEDLSLQSLNIPSSQVKVTIMHPDIHVECEDIQLNIQIGRWQYRRKGTLSFQDDGEATGSLSNVKVGLIIRSHFEEGSEIPRMGVRKCDVSVGEANLRFTGTKASWLYNLLSTLFQNQLKRNVEAVLQRTVSQAVDSQLANWTHWIFAVE